MLQWLLLSEVLSSEEICQEVFCTPKIRSSAEIPVRLQQKHQTSLSHFLHLTSVPAEHSEQWSVMLATSACCLSTSCYCPACLKGVWSPLHLPSRWTANMASDLSGHWLTVRKQHSTKCGCVCVWWVAVVGRTLIYSWKCIHKKW